MEEINAPEPGAGIRPPPTVRELVVRLAGDGHAWLSIDGDTFRGVHFAGADHFGLRFSLEDGDGFDLVSIPTGRHAVPADWGDDGVTLRAADGRTYRIEYRAAGPRGTP